MQAVQHLSPDPDEHVAAPSVVGGDISSSSSPSAKQWKDSSPSGMELETWFTNGGSFRLSIPLSDAQKADWTCADVKRWVVAELHDVAVSHINDIKLFDRTSTMRELSDSLKLTEVNFKAVLMLHAGLPATQCQQDQISVGVKNDCSPRHEASEARRTSSSTIISCILAKFASLGWSSSSSASSAPSCPENQASSSSSIPCPASSSPKHQTTRDGALPAYVRPQDFVGADMTKFFDYFERLCGKEALAKLYESKFLPAAGELSFLDWYEGKSIPRTDFPPLLRPAVDAGTYPFPTWSDERIVEWLEELFAGCDDPDDFELGGRAFLRNPIWVIHGNRSVTVNDEGILSMRIVERHWGWRSLSVRWVYQHLLLIAASYNRGGVVSWLVGAYGGKLKYILGYDEVVGEDDGATWLLKCLRKTLEASIAPTCYGPLWSWHPTHRISSISYREYCDEDDTDFAYVRPGLPIHMWNQSDCFFQFAYYDPTTLTMIKRGCGVPSSVDAICSLVASCRELDTVDIAKVLFAYGDCPIEPYCGSGVEVEVPSAIVCALKTFFKVDGEINRYKRMFKVDGEINRYKRMLAHEAEKDSWTATEFRKVLGGAQPANVSGSDQPQRVETVTSGSGRGSSPPSVRIVGRSGRFLF